MRQMIQKVLTKMTIAATNLGVNGYGQDALVNISTRGNIDPTDAEATHIGGFLLASEKRVIHIIEGYLPKRIGQSINFRPGGLCGNWVGTTLASGNRKNPNQRGPAGAKPPAGLIGEKSNFFRKSKSAQSSTTGSSNL